MRRIGISLLAAFLLDASAADLVPPPPAGHWTATLPIHADTVRLVVDLGFLHSRWVGEFDVPEYELDDHPVAAKVSDSLIELKFASAGAEFKGRLTADGQRLTGVFYLEADSLAAELVRTGEAQFSREFWALEAVVEDSTRVTRLSADGAPLRAQFNADRKRTRLVMLLSPS